MTQLMLTFKFEAANVNFQQFWTFLPIFKRLCCLTVFVVSEQVLNDLERFCTTLIKKEFFLKEEFVLVLGHKIPFPSGFKLSVAVFDVFKRILIFVLLDRFIICERALNNWKRFDTNLVNQLFVTTFCLVFGHKKQFLTVFSVFH